MQLLPLRPPNLSLNTIFVKVVKQLLRALAQVQAMETVSNASVESSLAPRLARDWPDLDVLTLVRIDGLRHVQEQIVQFS